MNDETTPEEAGDDWGAALAEQAEGRQGDDAAAEQAVAAELETLASTPVAPVDDPNLETILDIPVTLAMEIGRTQISIRNLLQLNQGSVVALDRLAGDPLDVMVNGTLVAHGEVVVVNEKFGIRLTDVNQRPGPGEEAEITSHYGATFFNRVPSGNSGAGHTIAGGLTFGPAGVCSQLPLVRLQRHRHHPGSYPGDCRNRPVRLAGTTGISYGARCQSSSQDSGRFAHGDPRTDRVVASWRDAAAGGGEPGSDPDVACAGKATVPTG